MREQFGRPSEETDLAWYSRALMMQGTSRVLCRHCQPIQVMQQDQDMPKCLAANKQVSYRTAHWQHRGMWTTS